MAPEASRSPLRGGIRRLGPLGRWETFLVMLLAAVVGYGLNRSTVDDTASFLSSSYLFSISNLVGETAIMALPLTLIVITGEIDLSVASMLGLASAVLGELYSHHWPMGLIFVTVLAIGAIAGAVNGILVTKIGLPSLAVTIGTLELYRGIADIILGPTTIADFPSRYTNIGINPVPHVPFLSYSVAIFVLLAVIYAIVLHMTPIGRALFAIGSNKEAALFAGIRVNRTKLVLFILSGVVCSLAGILYTFRLNTAVQDNGTGLELSVVAIVLLGGVSIFGGKGTLGGVVLAVFVFGGLQGAVYLTSFNQLAYPLVIGALLLMSVLLPSGRAYWRRATQFSGLTRARLGRTGTGDRS